MIRPRTLLSALLFPLLLAACSSTEGRSPSEPAARGRKDERMDWWREARFGLFLHWGLYAIPAGKWGEATGHGEWIRETAHIPIEEYDRFVGQFDPVDFDARAWVALAKRAGMRYIVITSKHHDGFCLFDSAYTDYDVMSTPFQRDIMKELSEACREAGLRMCWYHSIMDWHHPDYLPRRSWESRSSEGASFPRYFEHLKAQVGELLTNYGKIGVMWFDGEWESTWSHQYGQELYDYCRSLQPDVIVNNRVDVGRSGMAGMTREGRYAGDFGTPEQEIPATGLAGVDWETCMTMNQHWGYNAADASWKSSTELIRMLVDIASKGGNFLLNVGPTARGTFPPEAVERLQAIGSWMDVHGEAIHGTSASPLSGLPWGRVTTRAGDRRSTLYLCVFDWPADGRIAIPGLGNAVVGAHALERPNRPLVARRQDTSVVVELQGGAPDRDCSVIALELIGRPLVYRAPEILAPATIFVRETEVRLRAPSPELELRYSLDGSEPSLASPLYAEPLRLVDSTLVRARSFHDGRAVSETSELRFERVRPTPGLALERSRPGLVQQLFRGDWNALPDFDALEPDSRSVAARPCMSPELAQERLGARFEGFLLVDEAAAYTLALTSDDGSRLYLDGSLAIDNDGLHGTGTREGTFALGIGAHALRVEWFNKTGGAELELEWARAGEELRPVPPVALAHLE